MDGLYDFKFLIFTVKIRFLMILKLRFWESERSILWKWTALNSYDFTEKHSVDRFESRGKRNHVVSGQPRRNNRACFWSLIWLDFKRWFIPNHFESFWIISNVFYLSNKHFQFMLFRLNKPQLLPKSFILNKVKTGPFAKDYMFYLFQSVKTELLSHRFFLSKNSWICRVKYLGTIN